MKQTNKQNPPGTNDQLEKVKWYTVNIHCICSIFQQWTNAMWN